MQFELGTNWIRIRNEFTDQTLVPERDLWTHGLQTRTQQEFSGQELRIKSDAIVIRNPNWIDHQSRWLITIMNRDDQQSVLIEVTFDWKTFATSGTWLVTRQVRKILFFLVKKFTGKLEEKRIQTRIHSFSVKNWKKRLIGQEVVQQERLSERGSM